jgi:hypothetical protein
MSPPDHTAGGVGQLRAACLRGPKCRRAWRSPTSRFAAHTTEGIDLGGKVTVGVGGIGSPSWNRHQTRLDQLQPVEEAGDLFRAAEVVWERSTFVVALVGLRKRLADDVCAVVERQITTGRQGIQQPLQDRPRLSWSPMWPRIPISISAIGWVKSKV